MATTLLTLAYLVASVLFILALRGLSHPETSRQGNMFGMIGMAIAMLTSLASSPPSGFIGWVLLVLGLGIGGGIGAVVARRQARAREPPQAPRPFRAVPARPSARR